MRRSAAPGRVNFTLLSACLGTALLITIFWKIRLQHSVDALTVAAAAYRACMMNSVHLEDPTKTWDHGPERAIKECLRFGPPQITIRNTNDVKMLIPMKNTEAEKCTFVTLGVGQDVSAELQVQQLMPKCSFYGADPIDEGNKAKYSQIGQFFKYAVSGSTTSESQVLTNGNYTEVRTMEAMPLYTFLRQYVKEPVIDFLFIDTEYAEYSMFDLLQGSRAELEGFTFCQVNIEIHKPQGAEQRMKMHDFVKRLIREGVYVIGHDELPHANWHHRLFFFNQRSMACRRKFLLGNRQPFDY